MNPHKVTISTADHYNLSGLYWEGSTNHGVIYLHQFRHTKEDVMPLIPELVARGYHILSVDLRGHGESQGTLEKFSDADFKAMFNDARAAYEYLEQLNANMSVQMIGSSIGANTALVYQEMNTLESVVAISPANNYHGIDVITSNLSNIAMPVLYITSEDDTCVDEVRELYAESPVTPDGLTKLLIYAGSKHGIDIVTHNPQALQDIVAWLDAHAGKGLARMKSL